MVAALVQEGTLRVSVIIPAWGKTPFLERALASVPAGSDVEVVLSAPPPEAPDSLLAARRAGLKRAKGEWIVFLDADDRLAENAIASLASAASADVDMVCGNMARIARDGKRKIRRCSEIGPCDIYNTLCAKLIRKSLFADIKVDPDIRNGEDLLVVEQLYARCSAKACVDSVVYEYIENGNSITHSQAAESKARDLLKVDALLADALPREKYSAMHNRIVRDALLLLVRARKIGSPVWAEACRRLTEPVTGDVRHGAIKRMVLGFAYLAGKILASSAQPAS
ncbi:MAG: glycosyltransferase family 2 protein [Kiritimatiellia bacterium]